LPEHCRASSIVTDNKLQLHRQCGGALVKIGEDISEQLDVTPATFSCTNIRPVACRPCERIVASAVTGGD
jgi:transposase